MRKFSIFSIFGILTFSIALVLYLANAAPASAQGCVLVGRVLVCPQPGGSVGSAPDLPGLSMNEGPLRPLIPAAEPTVASSSSSASSQASSSSSASASAPSRSSSSASPTNTPTRPPTPTPLPTPTPFPSLVSLNEIMPQARNIDWNDDSFTNTNDEWVELYNGGPRSADISGWIIDTGDKTRAFTIPPGNSIPSLGYAIFFRRETKLELDTATQVRLLNPGGTVVDSARYSGIGDDQVYARSKDGAGDWRTGCVPSPYAKNCTIEATATSSFGLGYFRQTIAGPDRSFPIDVIVTNMLLAVILALAVGFFSNLLNDALESHESRVKQLFAPLLAAMQGVRNLGRRFDLWLERVHLGWLMFVLKLAVVLLLYGTLLAYLDPDFVFVNKDGALLILALALSAGTVSIIDDISVLLFLKRRGITSTVRLHSGNFALVFLSTLFSRWTGLTPGLLVGSPAGLEDVSDESKVPPQVSFLAVGVTTAVALVAWLLAPLFVDDAWLNSLLLLIFAAGIQTAFFEMFPVSYLHGRTILQTNRVIWAVWSAFLCAVFLQTMLNPDGAFVSAFDSPNMVILSAIVVAFCITCAALWFYLKRLESQAA